MKSQKNMLGEKFRLAELISQASNTTYNQFNKSYFNRRSFLIFLQRSNQTS